VVEVEVAEEDIDLARRLGPERHSEPRDAGAGIDDEEPPAAADLQARRVPAEFDELGA
jgi:hypothetical protein